MDDTILKETLGAFNIEFAYEPELLKRAKNHARIQFECFKQCWKLENLRLSAKPARVKASFIFNSTNMQCQKCIYFPYCEQIDNNIS